MGKGEEEEKKKERREKERRCFEYAQWKQHVKKILEKLHKTLSNMDLDLKYYIMFYYPDVGLMK